MDHGTLTDNNGRKADFRNTVVIMTTNAGASELSKSSIGFMNNSKEGSDVEAIERLFSDWKKSYFQAPFFAKITFSLFTKVYVFTNLWFIFERKIKAK